MNRSRHRCNKSIYLIRTEIIHRCSQMVIKSCTTNTKMYYFRQLSAPMHFTICTNQFSEPWNMIGMGIHHTEHFVRFYFILFVKAKWHLDGRTVTDRLSCSAFKAQCSDIGFFSGKADATLSSTNYYLYGLHLFCQICFAENVIRVTFHGNSCFNDYLVGVSGGCTKCRTLTLALCM